MRVFLIVLLGTLIGSGCEPKKIPEHKNVTESPIVEKAGTETGELNGYVLMKQNCLNCHFEKMDPAKRGSMIAPPIVRVQDHYKPLYPNREDFINAVVKWVKTPDRAKTNMPGAVRRFNLMPPLSIEDAKLRAIAGALFDTEFEPMGHGKGKHEKENKPGMKKNDGDGMHASLALNGEKKWKVKPETKDKIASLSKKLLEFKSNDLKAYQTLGRESFDGAKTIMLDESYKGKLFDQLHAFFASIEHDMHELIAAKDLETATALHQTLIEKFSKFDDYFE